MNIDITKKDSEDLKRLYILYQLYRIYTINFINKDLVQDYKKQIVFNTDTKKDNYTKVFEILNEINIALKNKIINYDNYTEQLRKIHKIFDLIDISKFDFIKVNYYDEINRDMLSKFYELLIKKIKVLKKNEKNKNIDVIYSNLEENYENIFNSEELYNDTELRNKIKSIVKYFTGNSSLDMNTEERKTAKLKNEKKYKHFLELLKKLKLTFDNELKRYVDQSGDELVSYKKVRKHMIDNGIFNKLPKGFEGYIDRNGFLYTKNKNKIGNKPNADSIITMNPNYNAKKDNSFVYSLKSPYIKGEQKVYTDNYKEKASSKKFKKVKKLSSNIDKYREKWLKILKGNNEDSSKLALITELIYQTQARIGNKNDRGTFGISTILGKNVNVGSDKITISYIGKDSKPQKHILKKDEDDISKIVYKKLKFIKNNVKGNKPFFTYSNGKPINSNAINKFIKEITGNAEISAHKFRHFKATKMLNDFINDSKNKKFKNTKSAEDYFKKGVEKIGKQLGHTKTTEKNGVKKAEVQWRTAFKSYIDPELSIEFFKMHNIPLKELKIFNKTDFSKLINEE